MLNRNDLKTILWAATGVIIAASVAVPFLVPHTGNSWPPSLGDWGDFLGGMGTLLALVWAIGGYFFNQMQIHETQKDIEDQLEIYRSAVGALTYMAAAMQHQVAEANAEAMPVIVSTGGLGPVPDPGGRTYNPRSKQGYIDLRNEGPPITLRSVQNCLGAWRPRLSKTGVLRSGEPFKLLLDSDTPIGQSGPVYVIVCFETRLGAGGWFEIKASRDVDGIHVGDPHMGLPPKAPET